MALVIVGICLKEKDNLVDYFAQAGILALTLNLITMGTGMISSKISNLTFKQAVTIAIESGIQNGTLAMAVATITLGDSKYAIAGAIYSLIMFGTALIAIVVGNRFIKES